jgi:hypothetical protein
VDLLTLNDSPRPRIGQSIWVRGLRLQISRARTRRLLGRSAAVTSIQQVNGYPALLVRINGEVDTVVAVRIDDGRISGLYAVRNPEKLSHMAREITLRR